MTDPKEILGNVRPAPAMDQKPRYRSPTHTEYVTVSLSEFDTAQLQAELVHRAHTPHDQEAPETLPADLVSRLQTLMLCGQRAAVLQELSQYLEPLLGGKIAP